VYEFILYGVPTGSSQYSIRYSIYSILHVYGIGYCESVTQNDDIAIGHIHIRCPLIQFHLT
jgi:hypothetical protein